jgi:hypothetical protein
MVTVVEAMVEYCVGYGQESVLGNAIVFLLVSFTVKERHLMKGEKGKVEERKRRNEGKDLGGGGVGFIFSLVPIVVVEWCPLTRLRVSRSPIKGLLGGLRLPWAPTPGNFSTLLTSIDPH